MYNYFYRSWLSGMRVGVCCCAVLLLLAAAGQSYCRPRDRQDRRSRDTPDRRSQVMRVMTQGLTITLFQLIVPLKSSSCPHSQRLSLHRVRVVVDYTDTMWTCGRSRWLCGHDNDCADINGKFWRPLTEDGPPVGQLTWQIVMLSPPHEERTALTAPWRWSSC